MKITVNGDPLDTNAATLTELLDERGFSGRVATAVNEQFIPIEQRDTCTLNDGDRIEILAPMQGG